MKASTRTAWLLVSGSLGLACGGSTRSTPAPATDSGTADAGSVTAASCEGASFDDLRVVSDDLYAYPPYAIDRCTLVYVADAGELRERDLATGAEIVVAPAAEHPRRPSIANRTLAWEARDGSARVVRVRQDGAITTVRGAFQSAGEPRAADGAVAFTGWLSPDDLGDTDVFLYDARASTITAIATGPGQQRFCDISATHVAFSDFSEDPDGRFDQNDTDLADVSTFDRATGKIARRSLAGKQAFPILASSDALGYLSWAEIHPEPKFQLFNLVAGRIGADGASDVLLAKVHNDSVSYVRPASARDGLFEWVDVGLDATRLYRASLDSPTPAAVAGLDGLSLFAPATASGRTILAARAASTPADPLRLRSIAR